MRLLPILLLSIFPACNYLPAGIPFLAFETGEAPSEQPESPATPVYAYVVVNTYPHDPGAFTQGLVYHEGRLYESTGLYGASSLRKVDLYTGEVLARHNLPPSFFGEGCAVFGDRIYQLTWKAGTCFVYDLHTFEIVKQLSYPTEGWGLTHDGTHFIMTDGSDILYFRDPETFAEIRRVRVRDSSGPVRNLNELAFIRGEVYTNVWQTDRIARIDPQSGRVTAWIDLTGILQPQHRTGREDVLNGIAYDADGDRMFVTGKWWPKLFHIRVFKNP